MRFFLLGLGLISFNLLATESVDFRSDREGKSYYTSRSSERAVARVIRQIDPGQITRAFEETVQELETNKLCSFDINSSLKIRLQVINSEFNDLRGAILYLRSQGEIDDIITKLLLLANKTSTTKLNLPKKREELILPEKEITDRALKIISEIGPKLRNGCLEETYKSLHGDIKKFYKNIKGHHLEAIFVEAFEKKVISYRTYVILEQARVNELESELLTLKSYYKKIKSLRTHFPLRDSQEKANFVTEKTERLKMSRRQRLFEGYSDLQIMLMANVIKRLRTRLEAEKAEILIYDRNNAVETITLEPMERFRLAIKLLRKENALLALNTYFAGRTPDYMDLMTAAYEVGMIPAVELEEVAGLQDIWNPKKTFWEKASTWVRTLSSVATVSIPPPYGFIPALAVVVIEMTAGKNSENSNDPTVLF